MNIIVLFQSQGKSNGLASSARDQLTRAKLNEHVTIWNFNKRHVVECVNIKIRNGVREPIDAVFICQDALDKVSWLKQFLKCDQWFVYDRLTCKPLVDDGSVPYAMMADCIHKLIKQSSGVVQRYVVGYGGMINKEDVYVCDLQPYHYEIFDEAKKAAINWITQQISNRQTDIELAQQVVDMYKEQLEQLKNRSE